MSSEHTHTDLLDLDGVLDFAPSLEATDHCELAERYGHFISGDFVAPIAGNYFQTINPATEEVLSEVAEASEEDVDRAVQAARSALPEWQRLSATERGKFLFRIARAIQERAREFAVIESLDGGKPIRESRDIDIPLAAAHFFYYGGWADKLQFAFPGRRVLPLGVVAQIIPWNFPLLMAAWKIAPALSSGNTVVLKSAETTPLTALKLAELIRDCGLPAGVVNILSGGPAAGRALCAHPDINKLAFTGSTEVGKSIREALLPRSVPVTLELGGKAAHIIFEDAAINQAVEGVVNGIFFNQGHVCCAGSRLLLQEEIEKEFLYKLKLRMETLVVGNPLDKNTDIGAINSSAQLERVHGYVARAKEAGLQIFESYTQLPERGYFCSPTLVSGATNSHEIVREEVFGPVLTVQTFRTEEEAVALANNTPYGLSAGVWTEKGARIFAMTRALRAGVVWANCFNKFDPASPFGGYKESGIGREGGLHGLEAYMLIQ